MLIEDLNAKKRSKMLQQKSVCNGEATGYVCEHYWRSTSKVDSNNADILLKGETQRACLLVHGQYLKMEAEELAVECNKYLPSDLPYKEEDDTYAAMTPGEYQELQKEFPSLEQPNLKPTQLPVLATEFKSLDPASPTDIESALTALKEDSND